MMAVLWVVKKDNWWGSQMVDWMASQWAEKRVVGWVGYLGKMTVASLAALKVSNLVVHLVAWMVE